MNRWWLTSDRWFVAGVIALVAAGIAMVGQAWPEAALFFAATIILLAVGLSARNRRDETPSARRSVDNVDAGMAARSQHGGGPIGDIGAAPPDYVHEYDEGRPRK
jgi:membrane protein implicated in regulation of membrane protease activity